MKYITLLLLVIVTCITSSAQTVDDIREDRTTYIYGEGRAATVQQADKYALSDIISQISVSIKSDFQINNKEIEHNGEMTLDQTFESIIETYSNATLINTERIIIENEPDAHVIRYIKRSDKDKLFESRKDKAIDMIETAHKALGNKQINDAIRYYVWAHTLIKSLVSPNDVYIYDEKGARQMANVWIPNRINEILSDIKVEVSDIEDKRQIKLDIKYKGEAVRGIDYTCWDGLDWSNIYSAIDGVGVLELRENIDITSTRLKVECIFEEEAVVDAEIKNLLSIIPAGVYKKAYINIDLSSKKIAKRKEKLAESETNVVNGTEDMTQYIYPKLSDIEDVSEYKEVIDEILKAIPSKSTATISKYFTTNGLECYKKLITYGSAKVVDKSAPKFYSFGDDVFCRNILMNFSFNGNRRQFMENVVFKFDSTGLISNITFGLGIEASEDILSKESWRKEARIILIHFMESYKTAYAMKQLDYIESIFDDDALIITGSYIRTATKGEMSNLDNKYVKLTRQSKQEYIRKLGYLFRANQFININFAENDLMKAGKGGEVYGIQIKQEYHSSSYGDTGYLFLMVDLNDIEKPIIHIRTWQPDKDPDFGKYGLQHF